jgi:hypothetical protein
MVGGRRLLVEIRAIHHDGCGAGRERGQSMARGVGYTVLVVGYRSRAGDVALGRATGRAESGTACRVVGLRCWQQLGHTAHMTSAVRKDNQSQVSTDARRGGGEIEVIEVGLRSLEFHETARQRDRRACTGFGLARPGWERESPARATARALTRLLQEDADAEADAAAGSLFKSGSQPSCAGRSVSTAAQSPHTS